MASRYTPNSRLAAVRVRGSKLNANIRDATTAASISLSTTSPTTMTLSVDDPRMDLLEAGVLARGASLDFADLELQIRSVDADDPGTGNMVAITARSEAWVRLKNQRGGGKQWKNTSPAAVVRLLGRRVGLKVVAQPSAKRRRITRGKKESDQGLIERYAGNLNFLTFIAGGTLYFGSPKWLARNGPRRTLRWDRYNRRGSVSAGAGTLVSQPAMRRAEDSPRGQAEMTALFIGPGSETWRPGHVIRFTGIPGFSGSYLVNSVDIPGSENEPVTVQAAIPQSLKTSSGDPKLRGEARATGTGTLSIGTPPSSLFTDAAMTFAVGAAGNAGGGSAVNPFTGAEMVSWCAARAGVTVNGSPAQMLALCRSRKTTTTVAKAVATRGALLFTGGRVGVAIGGGRVVLPSGRSYVIVSASTVGWSAAALVPGLRYGR